MSLNLTDEHAQMGKISNNLEKHGEEDVPGFAIQFVIMLSEAMLDGLMGRYFWRSLYNTDAATKLPTPIEGFRRCKPIELEDVFEDATVIIGDQTVEHEFKSCKAQRITLEPQVGGLTKTCVQVYLNPGLGDQNLWLQENQNCEVGLQICEGKIAKKKNPAQQSLPLPPPGAKPEPDVGAGFAAAAKAQVEAFNARAGEVIDGRSERVKHHDARKRGEEDAA